MAGSSQITGPSSICRPRLNTESFASLLSSSFRFVLPPPLLSKFEFTEAVEHSPSSRGFQPFLLSYSPLLGIRIRPHEHLSSWPPSPDLSFHYPKRNWEQLHPHLTLKIRTAVHVPLFHQREYVHGVDKRYVPPPEMKLFCIMLEKTEHNNTSPIIVPFPLRHPV